MHYVLCFETLRPIFQSGDKSECLSYIEDRDLSLSATVVSGSEDIYNSLSSREIEECYYNLSCDEPNHMELSRHPNPSELLWEVLCAQDPIPKPKKKEKSKKPKAEKLAIGGKMNRTLILGDEPKKTTVLHKIWSLVNDDPLLTTIDEIVEASKKLDTKDRLVKRYIVKMIRLGHLKHGEDEL